MQLRFLPSCTYKVLKVALSITLDSGTTTSMLNTQVPQPHDNSKLANLPYNSSILNSPTTTIPNRNSRLLTNTFLQSVYLSSFSISKLSVPLSQRPDILNSVITPRFSPSSSYLQLLPRAKLSHLLPSPRPHINLLSITREQ